MRSLVPPTVVALSLVTACHLADSPEPPTCAAGSHPFQGRCVADDVDAAVITIAASDTGSCETTPDSIKVAANGPFEFHNDDSVDHVIAGADGQAWVTAKAGQVSPYVGITKVGRWPYTVSGCAKGGTVVVE
ncbi:MAG: hypothetical protein JWP87_2787 [Labilithrix sp.]|nr:hypothetical protein [Labilithrix sp.]